MNELKPVDHSVLRINQAAIIVLLLIGFLINAPLLVAVVALFMLVGTVLGAAGFGLPITRILRPLGWVRPDILLDNPEPHRFAQGFGGLVTLVGFLALLAGHNVLGWALAWLVVALAALNLFAGFCAGCAVYYWLGRLHVPGFIKSPPAGTFPGLRPRNASASASEHR